MFRKWIRPILRAVPLGIGIATIVLVIQGSIEGSGPITFLSIGMICLAILHYEEK
ncbi:hypothetical protein GCM10010954_29540 [Halobacillus andaensis]|uniref:Uncharacterized protein n=1 Tax=Halobacillus andaensis TaxID=1176239 RepID=A0A917B902_HALAA|nr:hypothetical protein [Halobacillus andaensis]MBP2005060.1 hypothetical protein [Halobacillus andaensis]GGF28564.1 hypothetical protein GCM10010954_29540 [Halobacillus andaensis]